MSKDTIYRQAAIDANDAAFWETKNKKHYTKLKMLQSHAFLVETALKDLPSAQPETCAYWDRESNICALHRPSAQQNLQLTCNQLATDSISRQAAIDALGGNEPVGDPSKMDDDDVVKMWERIRIINIINKLPSAQPERTCVNCGRTANNGGWYADGRTRCPIEEHYALPKDGYCHLWEKRNVTDDDYPEGRADE